MKSTGAQSWNELQWLDLCIWSQNNSPDIGRHGDMFYLLPSVIATKTVQRRSTVLVAITEGWSTFHKTAVHWNVTNGCERWFIHLDLASWTMQIVTASSGDKWYRSWLISKLTVLISTHHFASFKFNERSRAPYQYKDRLCQYMILIIKIGPSYYHFW